MGLTSSAPCSILLVGLENSGKTTILDSLTANSSDSVALFSFGADSRLSKTLKYGERKSFAPHRGFCMDSVELDGTT